LNNKGDTFKNLVGVIKYLNFDFKENKVPPNFTDKEFREQIFMFIENIISNYNSVLIISEKNQTRSILVAQLYIMMKYKWNVMKTLEFLYAKK